MNKKQMYLYILTVLYVELNFIFNFWIKQQEGQQYKFVRVIQAMIVELKRACIEAIERIQSKVIQINTKYRSNLPKNINQILFSIQNQVNLLKDNFVLIMNKVTRLEAKGIQNQQLFVQVQAQYRTKYDQICQNYKLLEAKHQKMGQQLNFIKYSNRSLRKELLEHQNSATELQQLRSTLIYIKQLVSINSQNLYDKICNIVDSTAKKQFENPQHPIQKPIIQQHPQINSPPAQLNSAKKFNSCDLHQTDKNTPHQQQHQRTKRKSFNHKQIVFQHKQSDNNSQKKTKLQLAKLIEQQSRLSKIHQRYMSTNIV